MELLSSLRSIAAEFADLLFPPHCALCKAPLPSGTGLLCLCADCIAAFPPLPFARCPRCALPLDENGVCADCRRGTPPFAATAALGLYDGRLREAIQRLKYRGDFRLAQPLGLLLAQQVTKLGPIDRIVPVPLHITRLRQRSYNQSQLLAQAIGKELHIPTAPRTLQRLQATTPQQTLSSEERLNNLRGMFALRADVRGLRVLMVDDVMTTGATLRECAQVLLSGGAAEVVTAVAARTGLGMSDAMKDG